MTKSIWPQQRFGADMQHPIWWEKTVEYLFVKQHIQEDMVVSPFDGKHEVAGDAIMKSGLKWLLIEFKKDDSCFASEREKFKNWGAAHKLLASRDQHHFIIYGCFEESRQPDPFFLKGCTYFSRKSPGNFVGMKDNGANIETFAKYLEDFVSQKKPPAGSSAGGGVQLESYSQVMGINDQGKIVSCSTLQEFGLALGKTLQLARTLSISEPNPPSRRNGPSR